ncbi:MAG: regulatory protein RecX [Propionicimonas sp.]|uniref:regulatory protein RecX n=1 Tax=Propionicimonas sp. TaxID=1955623 RepID=UPI002B202AA4|nr:regulatory protein RecX [Propionicimonas sp.]MEA4943701.1 regulatory protein RecX [Propionicimonas sp.]MEA5116444.1 regulatory protein RecX [Propionicimonas sp.]
MTDEQVQPDEPAADPVEVAREIALRLLTVRPRSHAELQAAMARKGVPDEAATEVLERFTDVGLIDDAAFARAWVDSGTRRVRGRRVLARELATKGIDRELITEVLAERSGDEEWEAALGFARRKAQTMTGLDRQTRFRRLSGALARRGFGTDVVLAVVKEVLQEEPDEFTD